MNMSGWQTKEITMIYSMTHYHDFGMKFGSSYERLVLAKN